MGAALLRGPLDDELVPNAPLEIQVGQSGVSVQVELHRRQALAVQVVRGDGSPVPGSEVELIRRECGGALTAATRAVLPYIAYSGFYGTNMAVILDSGVTDREGKVV